MALHDVSVPIHPGMIIYRKNPGVELERALTIAGGDGANVSRLTMGVHSGTHIDGSLPLLRRRRRRRRAAARRDARRCQVVEVADPARRSTDRHSSSRSPGRNRSADPEDAELRALEPRRVHPRLRPPRRQRCFLGPRHGIRLVAIDYLSIGDHDAHVELLGNGVVALEGLDLRGIEPGPYELICLPMRLTAPMEPRRERCCATSGRGDG